MIREAGNLWLHELRTGAGSLATGTIVTWCGLTLHGAQSAEPGLRFDEVGAQWAAQGEMVCATCQKRKPAGYQPPRWGPRSFPYQLRNIPWKGKKKRKR